VDGATDDGDAVEGPAVGSVDGLRDRSDDDGGDDGVAVKGAEVDG